MPARAARHAQAPARANASMMDFGELVVAPVCTDARVGSEELASIGREDAGNHEVRCVFRRRDARAMSDSWMTMTTRATMVRRV